MASRLSMSRLTAAVAATSSRPALSSRAPVLQSYACAFYRPYSSGDAPPPPLLAKLKGDLKAAMKAKDAARLSVLRSVLAATLNASKTANPIKTDVQLVALLRKTAKTQKDASEEFRAAGRADLADKEDAQIAILEEYASGSDIETLDEAAIQAAVVGVLADLAAEGTSTSKGTAGVVMKRLLGPDGSLAGKDVDKATVARIVKRATQA